MRRPLSVIVFSCVLAACNTQVTVGSRYAKSQRVLALTGGSVTVTMADDPALAGTSVQIPPNALSRDTTITIAEAAPLPLPTGATALGPAAELGPSDATFAQPITIVLPCRPSNGQGAGGLSVEGLDSAGATIRVSGSDITVDAAAGTVAFNTSRLVTFGCTFSPGSGTTDTGGDTTDSGGGAGGGTAGAGGGSGGGLVSGDAGTYGESTGDAPTWHERVVVLMTNAARVDPAGYKATYGSDFQPAMGPTVLSTYPAVAPVYLNAALDQSARFHSEDMATNRCFQLDSCDGTNVWTRVKSFYSLSSTLGENYAGGFADPRQTVNQLLCSAPANTCCPDGAGCDGQRALIMAGRFKAVGVGRVSAPGTYYGTYWTQDFGGVVAAPMPPLVDGSHLFYPSQSTTTFATTFTSSGPPKSVSVVIDGVPTPLTLTLGNATRGHWAAQTARANACRSYSFEAVDAQGVTWRYPAHGVLRTTGEGGCTESFSP